MSQNNEGFNFYIYVPLVLTLAFLIGCLAVALLSMREDMKNYSVNSVSQFDIISADDNYSQIDVKENGGIRYYLVSTEGSIKSSGSETMFTQSAILNTVTSEESVVSEEPVSSEESISSENHISSEDDSYYDATCCD